MSEWIFPIPMNIAVEEHRRVVQGFQTECSILCRQIHIFRQELENKDKLRLEDLEFCRSLNLKISLLEAEINRLEAELNKTKT